MKVRELLATLMTLPSDLDVTINAGCNEYLSGVEAVQLERAHPFRPHWGAYDDNRREDVVVLDLTTDAPFMR